VRSGITSIAAVRTEVVPAGEERSMKKSTARAAVFSGVFAAAGLAGAMVASAAPSPPVVVFDEVVEHSGPDEICGVEATVSTSVRIRVTEWYDDNGEFVRGQAKLNGTTTIASELGTFTDRWAHNEFFDPVALELTVAGNMYNFHLPGSGTGLLVNDSGLITFNVETGDVDFVAGPHAAFLDEDAAFAEACDLVAS
jgi:hypothetical protein